MSCIEQSLGEYLSVELSGKRKLTGHLADCGLDLLVLARYEKYYYVPLLHVQNISPGRAEDTGYETLSLPESSNEEGDQRTHPFATLGEAVSFRKLLQNVRGHFVEIYVSGNTTIHGYLTSVMNDYFVFHSPVYRTIYVTLSHVKWLMPYPDNVTPYALGPDSLPHYVTPTSIARTFKDQCKKLVGSLVVFDMGEDPNKIGQLKSIDVASNMAELYTADGTRHLIHLSHLKTVYAP